VQIWILISLVTQNSKRIIWFQQ